MAKAPITLFTWNVNSNYATLELACRHLASSAQPTCIAALVEVPRQGCDATIERGSSGKLRRLAASTSAPSHHVILVGSQDVMVDPTGRSHEYDSQHDDNRRMQGLSLYSSTGAWANLQVLGVHGQDRLSYPTEKERNHWGDLMRRTLNEFWTGGPLAVIGDLNANPFHDELTAREGLFALRQKDRAGVTRKPSNEKTSVTSLYNPMWQFLGDDPSAAAPGTYYFKQPKRTELRWHCLDQIIVSEHLAPHLAALQIVTSLRGHSDEVALLDGDKVPVRDGNDEPVYSDHLPVQLRVDIQKVEPCKTSAKP